MLGVIACLCLSVGEGLQLRPFPVSELAEARATNPQLYANALNERSTSKYGPLDVPTRVQQRGKRLVLDYGNPPAQSSRVLPAHQISLPDTGHIVGLLSILLGSRSTGRAPPLAF